VDIPDCSKCSRFGRPFEIQEEQQLLGQQFLIKKTVGIGCYVFFITFVNPVQWGIIFIQFQFPRIAGSSQLITITLNIFYAQDFRP
jgi:hypothetical protein